jgi:hypothetical protein
MALLSTTRLSEAAIELGSRFLFVAWREFVGERGSLGSGSISGAHRTFPNHVEAASGNRAGAEGVTGALGLRRPWLAGASQAFCSRGVRAQLPVTGLGQSRPKQPEGCQRNARRLLPIWALSPSSPQKQLGGWTATL